MAPLRSLSFRKVFLFYSFLLLFCLFISLVLVSGSEENNSLLLPRRKLLEKTQKLDLLPKNETDTTASFSKTKNQTKLIKPSNFPSKNQTKLMKPSSANSSKNQTKLFKPITNSSKNKTKSIKSSDDFIGSTETGSISLTKIKLKKLNSTSKSSKSGSFSEKKSSDLLKTSSGSKNKTTKSVGKSDEKLLVQAEKKSKDSSNSKKSQGAENSNETAAKKQQQTQKQKQKQKQKQLNWIYDDEEEDLVSGFKDLPTKFQQTFVPDLHRISTNSKIYLNKANKEFTKGFKPYVGNKYAPTIATAISCAFIIIPLVLVSLIIHRIKASFSLQKIVIFIQIYLSIYFSILCLSSLATGLEPLRFLYATSQSTYVWLQVLQTLGYAMYLLILLMYLVLGFSTDSGLGSKFLSLAQTFVGFAVGLHYYMTVFHRVVLRQPPKTSWKIHGIYAACFLAVCLLTNAERRKKAYPEGDGEEGKKN